MTIRDRSRRSFLATVLGGSMLLCGTAAGAERDERKLCGRRRRRGTGVTDTDSGANADPANFGRGPQPAGGEPRRKGMQPHGRATGITDRDSGPRADPVNRGRGRRRPSPITDGDRGAYSDAPCGGS